MCQACVRSSNLCHQDLAASSIDRVELDDLLGDLVRVVRVVRSALLSNLFPGSI